MKTNINGAIRLVQALSKESLVENAIGLLGYAITRNLERLNKQEEIVSALKMRETLMKKHQITPGTQIDTSSKNFKDFAAELDAIFKEEIELDLIKVAENELDTLFSLGLEDITAMDIRIIETFLIKPAAMDKSAVVTSGFS